MPCCLRSVSTLELLAPISVSRLDLPAPNSSFNDEGSSFDPKNYVLGTNCLHHFSQESAGLVSKTVLRRSSILHRGKRSCSLVANMDETVESWKDFSTRQISLSAPWQSESPMYVGNDAVASGNIASQAANFDDSQLSNESTKEGRGSGRIDRRARVAEQLREGQDPIDVLESLPEWNPLEFWGVVDSLAADGRFGDALQVFGWWKAQEKYKPREQHYTTFIRMFGRAKMPEVAQHLFDEMKALDIQASVVTYSALLQGYAECGYFDHAEMILNQMLESSTKPNAVTYTGLIYAYGKQRRYDDIDRIFNKMKRGGCPPDFRTYSCLIEAYSRGGLLRRMERAWREMDSNGWAPDSGTINAIVQGYAKSGFVKEMHNSYMLLKNYRILVTKDSIRSMASTYIQSSKFQQLRLFVKDVSLNRRDVGNLLWNLLLLSYAASFQMRNLQKEFQAMKDAGFSPDLTTFNIRALGFSRMQMFWDLHVTVLHMWSEGVTPDLVTFGAVVDTYIIGCLRFRKMFEALDDLQMKGLSPDVRTDSMVFEAFGKGDFQSSSETLMQSCPRPYGVAWTYGMLTSFYLKKRATQKILARESQSNIFVRERLSMDDKRHTKTVRSSG